MECATFFFICVIVAAVCVGIKQYIEMQAKQEDEKLMRENPEAWKARQAIALREKEMELRQKELEANEKARNHNTALNTARIGAWFFKNW